MNKLDVFQVAIMQALTYMRTHLVTSMFHHHSSWSHQQVMKTIEHKTKTKPIYLGCQIIERGY
jgi:hypothetical protein